MSVKKIFLILLIVFPFTMKAQKLYQFQQDKVTRWASFENPKAAKGVGAQENEGAKGHAYDQVYAGKTVTLLDVSGGGIINRMWVTINDRSPEMLRSLVLRMYWDGSEKPAVEVPFGDFFGIGLGKTASYENALFSNPEGRSFNSYIPMPFKKGAKITVTNESEKDLNLLFYDVNFVKSEEIAGDDEMLYFHAYWHRNLKTELKKDFELLPKVNGNGRFLGVNVGVQANSDYQDTWFGEGEVKIYLNGDNEFPTLAGTGTEDYIGTGWGQGEYAYNYQGSPVVDKEKRLFCFYRYHIPDPIFFHNNIRVTIQQIGGAPREKVRELVDNGAKLIPISSGEAPNFVKVLEQNPVPDIHDENFPTGWTNFYREDDVSATAYFYLDSPTSNLPAIQNVDLRIKNLAENEK
ncbi:MAG: hypothetical protein CME35_09500 [Gramella sp.]|nr:hypothetical protein [Christiangramia sp.]